MVRAVTRIVFPDDQDQKFFGEGPFRLLKGVEETGSLRAASMQMNMAYYACGRRQSRRRKPPYTSRRGVAPKV